MKKCLFLSLCICFCQRSFATEWLTYYIYVQTEYSQGIWIRDALLEDHDYQYLEARQHEGLFGYGSESNQTIIDSIFNQLKREDQDRFRFTCSLSLSANYDTVILTTKEKIPDFEAVKNELTASFILNGFAAVKIIQPNTTNTFLLKDISVPYMDLVAPQTAALKDTQQLPTPDTGLPQKAIAPAPPPAQPDKLFSFPLILSFAVNLLLLFFLLRKKSGTKGNNVQ